LNTFLAPRFRLGWILIFIAAVNSFGWMIFRWNYENSMRNAQITLDYDDTRVMADAFGINHEQFLRELKKRGVTSIGLYEQSIANFRDNGRISVLTREEAASLYPKINWKKYADYYRYVVTASPENQVLTWQILNRLKTQSPPGQAPQTVVLEPAPAGQPKNASQFGILIPASKQILNDAQTGFDPAQVALAKKLGLTVTARVSNALNMDLPRARALLDDAKAANAKVVIFSEDEVLGYNSMIRDVAKEMRKRGLLFGNIEFSKQRGWEAFAPKTDGELVRVHSVGPDEASKLQPEVLTERFVRAVKERDIRVAYIRLIRHFKGEYRPDPKTGKPVLHKSALEQNYEFIEGISDELRRQPTPFAFLRPGMNLNVAGAFGNYPVDHLGGGTIGVVIRYLGLFLSSLGLVGGTLILLNLFFEWSPEMQKRRVILGISLVVLALILDLLSGVAHSGATNPLVKIFGMWPAAFGIKLMAMIVGCWFSAIGILWGGLPEVWDKFGDAKGARQHDVSTSREPRVEWRPAFVTGVLALLKTSAITLIGPLLIIALLNQWRFFSGADKYFFPKLTQLVPLLIIGLAFAGEVFPHRVIAEGSAAARQRARQWFRGLLDQPFTARVALLSVVLAVVGFIWIARTGNDSGMEISSLELKMRALLEQLFITRPRTKEIFLGHPAMIFAVYFALRRQWLPAFSATIIATIGQADMLNTFCHLHTPLFYSVLRSFHAIWMGSLIGGAALWAYHTLTTPRAFTPYKPARPVEHPANDL
jgi:hypothetical protein